MWQNETFFVLSNFSFCHSAFKCRLLKRRKKVSISGKGLNVDTQIRIHYKDNIFFFSNSHRGLEVLKRTMFQVRLFLHVELCPLIIHDKL